MFDTVFGLPTHALVVHAVVVLLPLAAIGGLAVVALPRVRDRFGGLVALLAVAVVPAVFVATQSGEKLEVRVSATFGPGAASAREAELMEAHTSIGENLLPWAVVLAVGLVGVLVLARTTRRQDRPGWVRPGGWVASAVVALGALLSLYWVIRIGDAGARAAWSDVAAN
ncbi:MAG: hypothetical protein H0T85_08530 [Geodermatophilaceae bacterium]|nr:hypothetical protein [Geodermatophilaceae bacterium]